MSTIAAECPPPFPNKHLHTHVLFSLYIFILTRQISSLDGSEYSQGGDGAYEEHNATTVGYITIEPELGGQLLI
jgi:hypothetical protein